MLRMSSLDYRLVRTPGTVATQRIRSIILNISLEIASVVVRRAAACVTQGVIVADKRMVERVAADVGLRKDVALME